MASLGSIGALKAPIFLGGGCRVFFAEIELNLAFFVCKNGWLTPGFCK